MISISFKPELAKTNKLIKYFKQIDKNRFYSNFGPLYKKCEKLIVKHFSLKQKASIFTSSGYASILASLHLIRTLTKKKYIAVPAFNFYAAPQAIIEAGFKPFFIDNNSDDLQINLDDLNNISSNIKNNLAGIIIVSPFGSPIKIEDINQIQKKYKCNIIYDAADTFNNIGRNLDKSNFFTCFSFHPTKNLGANESGLIICNKKYKEKLKSILSFGFTYKKKRIVKSSGFNGKFSEYDAAIFLANYYENKKIKKCIIDNSKYFRKKFLSLKKEEVILQKGFGESWFSSKFCLITSRKKIDTLINEFKKFNIDIFYPWSFKPMPMHTYFEKYKKTKLKNIRKNYKNIIGIPLNKNYKQREIDIIINAILKIFQ